MAHIRFKFQGKPFKMPHALNSHPLLRVTAQVLWALCSLLCGPLQATAAVRATPLRAGEPELSAKAVLVLHHRSGKILLERNAYLVRSIASLTKLQAALVFASRGLQLEEGTEVTRDDWRVALQGCRTRLELRWTYRNEDLLHAALLASDNRAVSALGRAVGLSSEELVREMNEKAQQMGLKNTHFRCPVGIDYGNVSTAWEMSQIVKAASNLESLKQVMRKPEYLVKPLHGYLPIRYHNTNPLVGSSKDVIFIASKTGYNKRAGYCIASVASISGLGPVTMVLLGSTHRATRVKDLRRLIQWLRTEARL
jgi:D-alanyl-D-alanine endopeptidase (penicillin-binding protein 7)